MLQKFYLSPIMKKFGDLAATVTRLSTAVTPPQRHLLLFHGLGFMKELWRPISNRFVERRAANNASTHVDAIYSFDLPSHGESEPITLRRDGEDAWFDWRDASALVVRALDAHANEFPHTRQVIVAHSMGAALVLMCALRRSLPSVESMLLAEPIVMPPPHSHRLSDQPKSGPAHTSLSRRDRFSSKEDALQWYKSRASYAKWHPEALQIYVDEFFEKDSYAGGVRSVLSPQQQSAFYLGGGDTTIWSDLTQSLSHKLPLITLLGGEASWYTIQPYHKGKTVFEHVATQLDKTQHCLLYTERVEGSHYFPFENIDLFVDQLEKHLQNVIQRTPKL